MPSSSANFPYLTRYLRFRVDLDFLVRFHALVDDLCIFKRAFPCVYFLDIGAMDFAEVGHRDRHICDKNHASERVWALLAVELSRTSQRRDIVAYDSSAKAKPNRVYISLAPHVL